MYYILLENLNISVLLYLWNLSIYPNLWIILNRSIFWNLGARLDLYVAIPVPVLEVPAGEEGEPEGLPNFLKEEEKEEYDEEKEKDDEEKEEKDEEKKKYYVKEIEMEENRRDEEDMQDSLVVEEGIMVNSPLVPFPLISFTGISCFKVLSVKKKLNNNIVEMPKDPASCILC